MILGPRVREGGRKVGRASEVAVLTKDVTQGLEDASFRSLSSGIDQKKGETTSDSRVMIHREVIAACKV